ncbi:MAG: hypothetical protein PHH54_02315 [Candidatus Nanoarchaeia archaeon]|nr:hypothetical protein [Candidatus Nanoarchaeia archaeon]MDD5740796.1 hypothetical protein [Candidatus Nanoarchaeia archaeon]
MSDDLESITTQEKPEKEENSELISENKANYRPLAHLVEVEERIKEPAALKNELRTTLNMSTHEISIPEGTGFCVLLDYKHSNCLTNKRRDSNCFETKAPGCRNYKIYSAVKMFLRNEPLSLFLSSYISKGFDLIRPVYEKNNRYAKKLTKNIF